MTVIQVCLCSSPDQGKGEWQELTPYFRRNNDVIGESRKELKVSHIASVKGQGIQGHPA